MATTLIQALSQLLSPPLPDLQGSPSGLRIKTKVTFMDHKTLQGPVSVCPSSLIWKVSPPGSLLSQPPDLQPFLYLESRPRWLLLTLCKSALV